MKSILDPTFEYVPSVETDIKKTFARVRKEMAGNGNVIHERILLLKEAVQHADGQKSNVAPLKRKER